MRIELPISKSIANRLLILQAIHGDGLLTVSATLPEDVQILHRALTTLNTASNSSQSERPIGETPSYSPSGRPIAAQAASCSSIELGNCGTAMRFLTAYAAQLENKVTVLDGVERMRHRPIGQLVDALREIGADIEYIGEEGFPPLRIKGCILDKDRIITLDNPQSTQFVSALLLIGANIQTNSTSPYITLTREIIDQYPIAHRASNSLHCGRPIAAQAASSLEKDWSSAAFWYEYVALHGGEITLHGLFRDSLQGDKVVADIFAHLGVHTEYTAEGITITKNEDEEFLIQQYEQQKPTTQTTKSNNSSAGEQHTPAIRKNTSLSARCVVARAMLLTKNVVNIVDNNTLTIDFSACPDLYPAVALTCERLGIELHATGVESLPLKESDRLRAVREYRTDHDHRMAMALLIAGYEVDDIACISKSYPQFIEEYRRLKHPNITIVIPRRGINDEGKGKKHALYRLISAAETEYVWMMDDDIVLEVKGERLEVKGADLLILPLRMASENERPSLLERLQIAEYAAIQQLTIETAKRGHAVMCSGANLIAKRDRWLESYPDLHPEIPSGDDMFLLESFKRRRLKIAVSESEELTAIVRPHTSWRAFFRQRMRWAGKAPKYTDNDILCCGATILVANLLQLLCPLILLVKFPIEYHLMRKRDQSIAFVIAILLELLYPFYMLLCLIGGLMRRKW